MRDMSDPNSPAEQPGHDPHANPPPPSFEKRPPAAGSPPPGPGYPPPGGYGAYPSAPPPGQPAQAPPGSLVFDPNSGLYLPAGTELAPVGRRIGAYFLSIPLFIVTLGIGYLIWGLILWGKGTTPALHVLRMKCYRPDERTIPGFWRMALREVIGRLADSVLSLISMIISFVLFVNGPKRQSLHDLVGGTVVLYDPNKILG